MNLLRDPAAASAFLHDPEGALDSAGLGGVCTDDVDAVMPVILDMAPVAAISGSVLGTGGNSVDGGDAHNSGPGGAVEGTGGDSLPRPSRHSPPSSTTSPTRTWTTGTR
nr:IniB N-terminal domain-containing protein [Naasia aerilata]